MAEFIEMSEGDFFVQEEWNSVFEYLTCVGVGDLPKPFGDLTPSYCPDPTSKGKFQIDGWIQGEPGAGTTTLERPMSSVSNWLIENECEFQGQVTMACRGQRANPQNYDVAVVLHRCRPTTSTILSPAARQPGDNERVNTNVDISYTEWSLIYQLAISQQSISNTQPANDVAFLPQACESKCGSARGLCEEGYMALDGAIYDSEIKYTVDSGSTWTATTNDPFFLGGEDSSSVLVLETATGHRGIVAKGSNPVGNPAEISWTGDYGATAWNNVFVGTVLGQTIQQLFHYQGRIWAAASGGYIYMSADLGDTWTTQESAQETTQQLNDIVMFSSAVGYAVGNNNAFLYTLDGGTDWASRTGPVPGATLNTVAVNDKGHVFVGTSTADVWVSEDEGVTWTRRRDFGTGNINAIRFDEKFRYFAGLLYDNATPVGTFYRSTDGGASWQAPPSQPDNNGINDMHVCDQNNFVIVGELDDSGNTFVAKVGPIG